MNEPTPHGPVRDDRALGATEDLDREPDGMPHNVMGMTYFFSILLAMLVAVMFMSGHTAGRVAAVFLVVVAVPVLVGSLRKRAEYHRDRLHPSR